MKSLYLSPRQVEVCCLVAAGYSYDGVARELKIKPKTVEFHMENAASRLLPFVPHLRGCSPRRVIQGYYVEFAGVAAFQQRRKERREAA